jgi:formylglycine-generating enzyme required for sulfatase activity
MWWCALVSLRSMLPAAPSAHAGCDGVEAQARNDTRCLGPKDTFRECAECTEMVMVPAGTFIMGSPMSEEGRLDNEEPRRMVINRAAIRGRQVRGNVCGVGRLRGCRRLLTRS